LQLLKKSSMVKNWFRFIGSNKRMLNFGFLFNFFSAFGQTFFISLFVPFWVESFKISHAAFGSIYALVTVVAAVLLSLTGRFIDRMPLKRFGSIVFTGLMISTVLLALAGNIVFLVAGLLLVRWLGQGMMTHTSQTGIAKHFDKDRGKALGITALGRSAGQFIMPLLVLPLLTAAGWRTGLIIMAAVALAIVVPILWTMVPAGTAEPDHPPQETGTTGKGNNYLLSGKFWIIAANAFLIPFIATAIVLYQYTIGQYRGWDASWIVFSFAFYAIFSAVGLLLSGNLVDRFTGIRLFPLYLIPALASLVLIALISASWILPVFYGLLGLSTGLGNPIRTAVLAEIYGISSLGKIRSYFATIMVISTAVGPPIFGYLMDRKVPLNGIFLSSAAIVLVIILMSFKISASHRAYPRRVASLT